MTEKALITTVTRDYNRISMHGVRRTLLEQQAASLGYPITEVYISLAASDDEYEIEMQKAFKKYIRSGVSRVAFGDIFLEDLRKYREENLRRMGMKAIFPLWKRGTSELAHTFVDLGFKAIITCVDSKVLGKEFVGRPYDKRFLADLPSNVDTCGENGEFHSFAYDGPNFRQPVSLELGDIFLRDNRFYYCDLKPAAGP
jgi:uncharacterized protein (TIGR00290 family)